MQRKEGRERERIEERRKKRKGERSEEIYEHATWYINTINNISTGC
jgi:hypothetical protein